MHNHVALTLCISMLSAEYRYIASVDINKRIYMYLIEFVHNCINWVLNTAMLVKVLKQTVGGLRLKIVSYIPYSMVIMLLVLKCIQIYEYFVTGNEIHHNLLWNVYFLVELRRLVQY